MRSSRWFFASALAAAACSGASSALAADPVPSLDLRGFHAPTDPNSGLYLENAASPDTGEWNVGLWANYVYRPVTLKDPTTGDTAFKVLNHQLTADAVASVGIMKRFTLGIDMPVLLYQTGDTPTTESTRVLGQTDIPKHGLGDLGLNAKITLLTPTGGEFGGFALALHERFTVPTGDPASFLGEGSVTSETRLLAEYRLVALGVHGALGFKYRGEKERYGCEAVTVALDGSDPCPSRFGHELPFGLGLSLKPQALGVDEKGRMTFFLETHGYVPLSPVKPFESSKPAEAQIGLAGRYAIGDASILAGVEHAMIGGVGNAPFRATLGVGWAPRAHDADHDGIPDDVDQCRELAEDKDGFQDEDGCPDGDNDDDGVPDADDKCPTTKEDEDGFQDEDGCPDPDNDQDGILDKDDACPNEAGPKNADPKKNGCPIKDPDGDGIAGDADKCPNEPEDKDGFQDADGCPDPDNDGDGINDKDDACPNVKGIPSTDPKRNGCPDADPDKDTFLNPASPTAVAEGEDKCPNEPETWNGYQDEDGCPDEDPKNKKQKPLVVVREKKGAPIVEVAGKLAFTGPTALDPKSTPLLRALASQLLAHPEWSLAIGVRPPNKAKGKPEDALSQSKAAADAIVKLTNNPKSAEGVDWSLVKGQPGAETQGIGYLLRGYTPPPPPEAAAPKGPPSKTGTKAVAAPPKPDGGPKAQAPAAVVKPGSKGPANGAAVTPKGPAPSPKK